MSIYYNPKTNKYSTKKRNENFLLIASGVIDAPKFIKQHKTLENTII